MSIFSDNDQRTPFLIPFVVALIFGIPVAAIWYLIAMKVGIVAKIVTILLGFACGLGARTPARGWHPAGAAIIAALILIVVTISAITISLIASRTGESFPTTAIGIALSGDFGVFANACVEVAGRTFVSYPLGLYAAYRLSDAS